MLFGKSGRKDDLVVRGARVLDPTEGLDTVCDVRVDGGTIAELGTSLDANGHRVIDGSGLVLAPAFVDPHVHLRTPGREDEETIASGTAAAAAGGYCAILAMPNTDPVVDSAAVLGSLIEQARADAVVPVGFLAAITKGQQGAELTEMGELADEGAAGLTDDGRPVRSPGLMRRALQYASITGRRPGTISCVATDHAPHARHEKEVPFEEAPFGVTGLETAFAALYTYLVEPGLLRLETLLERMSVGPARAYGLEPPRIAVGAPANLVLIDENASWHVTEQGFRSR